MPLIPIIRNTLGTESVPLRTSTGKSIPRSSIPVLLVILLLTGCDLGPMGSLRTSTPLDRWVLALQQRDYDTARTLVVEEDFAVWRAATDHLFQQHQGLESYQRLREEVLPDQRPVIVTQWLWKDGTIHCMRVQVTYDGKIDLLDPTYQNCSDIS
jgi:hypothetical protein